MKKIINLILILFITINSMIPINAKGTLQKETFNIVNAKSTKENFEKVFNHDQFENNINYSWTLHPTEHDDIYTMSFEGIIYGENDVFVINASGEVSSITLALGETYLQGPLYGSVTSKTNNYDVIIGVQGIKETEKLSFGISLYTDSQDKSLGNTLLIFFGDFKKTETVVNKIQVAQKNIMEERKNSTDLFATSDSFVTIERNVENSKYSYYTSADTYFSNCTTGNIQGNLPSDIALKMKVYTDTKGNRIAITASSNVNKLKNMTFDELSDFFGPYGNSHNVYTAKIDECELGLKKVNGTGSHIIGIEKIRDVNSQTNYMLKSVFLDTVGIQLPFTWTLSQILENAQGKVDYSNHPDYTSVRINIHEFDDVNFDNRPMRISCALSSNFSGATRYIAFSKFTYHVDTSLCLFYFETQKLERSLFFTSDN